MLNQKVKIRSKTLIHNSKKSQKNLIERQPWYFITLICIVNNITR